MGEGERGYSLFFVTSGQKMKKVEKTKYETEESRDEAWWLSFEESKRQVPVFTQTASSDQVRWGNRGFVNGVELLSTMNNCH